MWDLPSLIVSIVALVVSIGVGIVSFRQARSTADQANSARIQATAANQQAHAALAQATAMHRALELDQSRFRTEQTPRFSGVVQFGSADIHLLRLALESAQAMVDLSVTIIEGAVEFASSSDEGDRHVATRAEIEPGVPLSLPVRVLSYPYPQGTTIEVTARIATGGDSYTVPVDIPVFPELEEREPHVRCTIHYQNPPPHRMELNLDSPETYRSVTARIVGGRGVAFVGSPSWADVDPGQNLQWPIRVESNHSARVQMAIDCTAIEGERFTVVAVAPIASSFLSVGQPRFEIELERSDRPVPRLKIRLASIWPVDALTITLGQHVNGIAFLSRSQAQSFRPPTLEEVMRSDYQTPGRRDGRVGQLRPGSVALLPLRVDQHASRMLELDFECTYDGGRAWSSTLRFEMPAWIRRERGLR